MRAPGRGAPAFVPFAAFAVGAAVAACSGPSELVGEDHSADTGSLGYCRTTTCAPPNDYPLSDGTCEPDDWAASATCISQKESNAPLWWSNSCVGYDLNQSASKRVPYAQFAASVEGAFQAWTGATCGSPAPSGTSRPSIDVRDLGPVSCASAYYDKNGGPNQNVIVFHDDAWPYEAADRAKAKAPISPVVALTTVTYDPESGEIFDADVELNSADYTIAPLPSDGSALGSETFDLQAILTHELGHFFGLAHSPLPDAVMNASGDSDTSSPKRALRLEDTRAICVVYPADGTRAVSTLVASSQSVAAGVCDPTPRHGLSLTCP
jgi:hypothetical protein